LSLQDPIPIGDFGKATHDKATGIFRAKKVDLFEPLLKEVPLLTGRLLFLVVRRHVMIRHVGDHQVPLFPGRRGTGFPQRGDEVETALLFLGPVAARAGFNHEGRDTLLK